MEMKKLFTVDILMENGFTLQQAEDMMRVNSLLLRRSAATGTAHSSAVGCRVYLRLRHIYETCDSLTFTSECAQRLLRVSVLYATRTCDLNQVIQLQRQTMLNSIDHEGYEGYLPHCASHTCFHVQNANNPKFQICASCRLASYCSRECQIFDWRNGHKQECVPVDPESFHAHH